jgi:hypothetical protein
MEPKVGQVSGVLEEREQGIPRGSKRWAGRDYGWQTQESFEKALSMRNGGAFFDFTRQFIGDPVEQTLGRMQQALTKTGVYQNILKPIIEPATQVAAENIPPIIQSSAVGQTLEDAEIVTEAVREELRQRGQDPRFADTGRMLAEEAVGGVLGKTVGMAGKIASKLPPPSGGMALATAASTPMPPSMSVVPVSEKGSFVLKAVTITDPETLRVTGRRTGEDALSPEQAKQQTKRILDIQKAENALAQAEDELATLADIHGRKPTKEENPRVYRQFQNALGAKGRAQTDLSRAQSNVLVPTEDNPLWYKTTKALFVKKQEQLRRGLTQALEQHHKFPKGLSGAYFSRMDELIDAGLAEPDDLFVMAEYARKKGVEAGDVRSNLANQVKKPHTELHRYMRNTGEEMSKTKWKQVVKEAKDVDELMVLWRDIIDNNVIPNYKLAEVWQPLDDLVREIQGIK